MSYWLSCTSYLFSAIFNPIPSICWFSFWIYAVLSLSNLVAYYFSLLIPIIYPCSFLKLSSRFMLSLCSLSFYLRLLSNSNTKLYICLKFSTSFCSIFWKIVLLLFMVFKFYLNWWSSPILNCNYELILSSSEVIKAIFDWYCLS